MKSTMAGRIGWRDAIGLALVLAFSAALGVLLTERVRHVNTVFGGAVGCDGCFDRSVLVHDLTYLAALLLLLLAGFGLRRRWVCGPLRLLALAGLLVYALDVAVSREMFTRLRFGDLLVFAAEPGVLKKHIDNTGLAGPGLWTLLAAAVVLAVAFLAWPSLRGLRGRWLSLLTVLPVGGMIAGQLIFPGQYVHDWALRNVLAANLNTGVSRPYAEATVAAALAQAPAAPSCAPGRQERDNVIVLVLESWSPYQSALFGGLNDWTPRLDAIARANAHYTRMHAAGFTTNEGLMGLLAGMELLSPVKPFFSAVPFETTWGLPRTVPKMMAERGYRTSFLTTGDLAFTRKREWLKDVGFDHVEGHEHPAYDGLPRLHFESAPDEALYARVLTHLDELGSERPYLVVIESVSSHHPYVHPHTGERTAEAVFRYMDQSAADFHDALQARGFFEHGQLFITSDHRAMVPVGADERERLGRAVLSRIPALWAGRGVPERAIDTPFHQADLIDTLERSTAARACGAHGVRDMLAPADTASRCLYHARGDSRDLVDVFCPDGEGTIRLSGDDTSMDEAVGLGAGRQAELVRTLNYYRIVADRHQDAWISQP